MNTSGILVAPTAVVVPTSTPDAVEQLEAMLIGLPQVEGSHEHLFAPGVYCRQFTMPAGCVFIGHEHKTEHFNAVMKGHAIVLIDGVRHDIRAGAFFPSKAGVRKVLLILEETVWVTIHPTTETDLGKLEELLIVKSPTWLEHHAREVQMLQNDPALETAKGGTT